MRIDAIDVIHYHPFVFANALPHVRSFAGFRLRVYPFRQVSISTVDIFRNSLFNARCSIVSNVKHVIFITYFRDVGIDS